MNKERVSDPIFTFAFQPTVNALECEVVSYEALIRRLHKERAAEILSKVPANKLYSLDQIARVQATSLVAHVVRK
jgi:EAL domain-containing protein (putative c-di-GMP-specific phosphodiesterase class I)